VVWKELLVWELVDERLMAVVRGGAGMAVRCCWCWRKKKKLTKEREKLAW
jgi:hypothetical protein